MRSAAVTAGRRVVHALGGHTMGTTWSVKLAAAPDADLRALHRRVQARLDAVVAQMSNWAPDSDLGRYNTAPAGSWHELPDDFRHVLDCALDIARASGGAFDPTVGPLVDAWGFGPPGPVAALPAHDAIDAARERVDWRRVRFDAATQRLLQPGGLCLDLCAIAKGFAVDAVADALREAGIDAALVEVGGELRGDGRKPDGEPWRVIVEGWSGDERDDAEPRVLALDGLAVATSGDRWHGLDDGARRHSHTLDPRRGLALHDAPVAVTVVADRAMHADAWATALTVLGDAQGFTLACERGLAARFVGPRVAGCIERMTPAFEALLAR